MTELNQLFLRFFILIKRKENEKMAKLFTVNEAHNGQIGPVQFVNGVAVTDNEKVIERHRQSGGIVVEDSNELSTFDILPKETLVGLAEDMELDPSGKTKKEILDLISEFIEIANA